MIFQGFLGFPGTDARPKCKDSVISGECAALDADHYSMRMGPKSQPLVRNFPKHGERGQAVVEFALVASLLLFLLLAIIVFGIAFNNYLTLTNATSTGALILSESRGQTSDFCSTTVNAVKSAASSLTSSQLGFTIVPNTAASASYGASPCPSASPGLTAGQSAQVTVTYPCKLQFMNFNRPCTLTASTQVRVQ